MFRTSRKLIGATGLAGSLLLGGVAIASAQSTSTNTAAAAAASAARPDRSVGLQTTLKPLVTAGTITQAQADAIVKALVAAEPMGGHGGPGGPGRSGGPGGRGGPGGGMGNHADTMASALGVTAAELQTQLSGGKTIAQVATAKGVAIQKVIDAVVSEEKAEHPTMSAADVTTRVTNMVNGVRPARPANAPTQAA